MVRASILRSVAREHPAAQRATGRLWTTGHLGAGPPGAQGTREATAGARSDGSAAVLGPAGVGVVVGVGLPVAVLLRWRGVRVGVHLLATAERAVEHGGQRRVDILLGGPGLSPAGDEAARVVELLGGRHEVGVRPQIVTLRLTAFPIERSPQCRGLAQAAGTQF